MFLTEIEVDGEMIRCGLRLGPACLSPGNDGSDSLDKPTQRHWLTYDNIKYFILLFVTNKKSLNDNLTEVMASLIDFPKELNLN